MMADDFKPTEKVKTVIRKYRDWLNLQSLEQARKWGLLCCNNLEAGAMEAVAWAVLRDCGVDVSLYDDLSSGDKRPDFVCHKDGQKLYVEVTCMTIAKVVRETGFADKPDPLADPQEFQLLTDAIFQEVQQKTRQCANLDAPCVLFIGTFHWQASCMCIEADCVEEVLTGKTGIALRFDPARGPAGKPFHATNLESGAFVRRGKKKLVEHARQSVSAVVIAGVGCQPPNIFGAMHPRAMRQFDPSLLDRIPFCRLGAGYDKGLIRVEWLNKPPTGSIPGR